MASSVKIRLKISFLRDINIWLSVICKLILAGALILPHSLHAAPRVEKEELKQLRSRIESLQEELADTRNRNRERLVHCAKRSRLSAPPTVS